MDSMPEENAITPTVVEVARLLQGPAESRARLVCLFGSMDGGNIRPKARYILDVPGEGYRVLEDTMNGSVPPITPVCPAAAWYERELKDQYGVELPGHPDPRPLLLHENWPRNCHPMIANVATVPWADERYEFLQVEGDGVCEVAVGPVHAGVIEPGHFRFSVVGDNVLFLELRHFYTHKGTEKLFQGTHVLSGQMLAESVSGDNCFAHAVAYSQAIEEAHAVTVPHRAELIRLIGLELERMMAHIADVGALSGDVAFVLPAAYCSRIKEDLMQTSVRVIGSRFWRGIAVPGGVARDISPSGVEMLRSAVEQATSEFAKMAAIMLDRPSVQSRFEAAVILRHSVAADLAVVGPVARSSGIDADIRRDHPYGAYRGLSIEVPSLHYGDVLARARVRIEEFTNSSGLIPASLMRLSPGPIKAEVPQDASF